MPNSSSNPTVTVEIEEERPSPNPNPNPYPYPSHVCANFVTVQLTGTDTYSLWKTQMLCLLESHGMLGFIDGTLIIPETKVGDSYVLWRRSDALVKGWILASLSEPTLRYVFNRLTFEIRPQTNPDFTAKDVWDKLQSDYDPFALFQADLEVEEERKEREAEPNTDGNGNSVSEEDNSNDREEKEKQKEKEKEISKRKKEEEEERAKVHQNLYEATLSQNYESVANILKTGKVAVGDKITINGNTALHVAVGTTTNMEFVQRILVMAQPSTLLHLKNSDGSTLLHVAAIVGNTEAAKFLVGRNRALLLVKDNEGHTPLARALSNMHIDTYLYLLNPSNAYVEMGAVFAGKSGDEILVNAISSKDFDSAQKLMHGYRTLHSDVALMAIAQNFPSELNSWERRLNTVTAMVRPSHKRKSGLAWMTYLHARLLQALVICNCSVGQILGFCCYIGFTEIKKLIRYILETLGFTKVKKLIQSSFKILGLVVFWPFKVIDERARVHSKATNLLKSMCKLVIDSKDSKSHHHYYTNPVLEATSQNAYEVVEIIVSFFPNAIWSVSEDGHNIIQHAVINRSEKVDNLLYQMSQHKHIYKTMKDTSGNNLLHLAGRLAPTNKLNLISGAALQIQRELQWFKEVEAFVCPLNIIQKNSSGETPKMVFTREHKDLVIDGEKWMKVTAESYTITAALITTIVFAAAITVPGGSNQETGIPLFTNKIAFTVFAISDAISLFTSVTSLLMFLSILTARFAEQDFLLILPTKLIFGLATLFISTTAMIVAFGATLFLVFGQKRMWILYPIAALTCLPIASFMSLQFPLIWDLMSATFGRSIFGKKRDRPFY